VLCVNDHRFQCGPTPSRRLLEADTSKNESRGPDSRALKELRDPRLLRSNADGLVGVKNRTEN